MTLSVMGFLGYSALMTLSINDTKQYAIQHNSIKCHYAECHYGGCHYAECA
jgi:hypothetical protein